MVLKFINKMNNMNDTNILHELFSRLLCNTNRFQLIQLTNSSGYCTYKFENNYLVTFTINALNTSELKIIIPYLERFTKLKNLVIKNTHIHNTSIISNLIQLNSLYINYCNIKEIDGVRGFINLTMLDVSSNHITNIDGVKELVNLKHLNCNDNLICDLSSNLNHQNLMYLYLNNNKINDINHLGNFANLHELTLSGNLITNIDSLDRIKTLESIDLRNNNLTTFPIFLLDFLNLEILYKVDYSSYYPNINLFGNQISNIPIDIIKKGNEDIKNFLGIENEISFINTISDLGNFSISEFNDEQAELFNNCSYYKILNNSINEIYITSKNKTSNKKNKDFIDLRELTPYFMKFPKLDSLTIRGYDIINFNNISHFCNIRKLSLINSGIKNIEPIYKLIQLEFLDLSLNEISDISPLKYLIHLREINLNRNYISNIEVLANLSKIKHLYLKLNSISDITPITKLEKLETLELSNNHIVDIDRIFSINSLSKLYLSQNKIQNFNININSLSLSTLDLSFNNIKNISGLKNLTNLKELFLAGNKIFNIKPIESLIYLEWIDFESNHINDIEPLKKLYRLNYLNLGNNKITNISHWIIKQEYELNIYNPNNFGQTSLIENSYIEFLDLTNNPLNLNSLKILNTRNKYDVEYNEELIKYRNLMEFGEPDCNESFDSSYLYDDNLDADQQSQDYWEQF